MMLEREAGVPTSTAGWFAVLLFCVAQIISTIDRGMLSLVIDPVRADLQISEVQIALLQGFAFAVFYVTVGLPLGMVADRTSRRRLLVAGIVVWSLATIGGGLARDFSEMFASRLFIGIGEAVLGPCAVTMISDLFPAERRGRPMAVYVFGSMIAYGLGSMISGYVLEYAPQGAFDAIPLLQGLAPWRIAFILVGSAGFVVAALMLLLREPPRPGPAVRTPGFSNLGSTLRPYRQQWPLFLPLYASLALFALGASAATGWGAVLLTRNFGFDPAGAGKALGAGQMAWAALGAIVASLVVDRVARRAGATGKIRLAALLALAAVPACLAGGLSTGWAVAALLSQVMFVTAVYGTTMLSVITEVAPSQSRGFAVALYAFVMTMIGGSLGPLAVAFLTERVFGAPGAVGGSMAIVGSIALAASALLSLRAARVHGATRVGTPSRA